MESVDQIISAKWIITCENANRILENHALVIKDGKIKDILPTAQATEKYSAANKQEFNHHAILPGFINTHTHLAMHLFRGLADDLPLMDWLNHHIWPAERKWVSQEFVRDASMLAIAEMIRGGSTTFNDMYFFLQATAEAADIAGVRGHIGITVIDFPTAWAQNVDEYLAKGVDFYNQYKDHPRITATMAPHAIYTVAEPTLLKVKEIADKYKLRINMHVQETADEVNQSIQNTGQRPLKRLENIGLVTPDLIAVHMTQINDEDMAILAQHKPQIVHCPESNMKLASGTCPVEQLRSLGLNIALGTDGAASNNDVDMISEMRVATLLSKLSTLNPQTMPAESALKLATINGAKALGIDHITGSIEIGKAADFIAMNLDELETMPVYNPLSQVVYSSSRQQVTDVWVAGKQLMKNRQLTTLDEHELKAKANQWRGKIKSLN